ncbi:MAG: YlmH/Sll1252 family protein [Clostridiales bacterium]|nr:YlmH/Sll1252 family protein [Eubacteriales bacterium]MDH7565211.1 YlmH/Sll1252 family protein [Clostridiales bacterium]
MSKIIDKAIKSEEVHNVIFSDFLDPYQKKMVADAFSSVKEVNHTFNGGYSGAEREIVLFCPEGMSIEDFSNFKYPFKILNIKIKARSSLTHRDFLGALMSLGIKREKIGDILVKEDTGTIVVLGDMADYIKCNLAQVGDASVDVEVREAENIEAPESKVKEITTTVASLRLDSISSAGFGISRSKIVEFIRAEKVSLNWEPTGSLTKLVKEGDVISIKGKGRVVVDKIGGTTKKGRIGITLKKLV